MKLEGKEQRFAIAVKGQRGRKWYAADETSSIDHARLSFQVFLLRALYPHLQFEVKLADDLRDYAPRKFRPWGDGDASG